MTGADGQPLHRVRITLDAGLPNAPATVTDTRGAFEIPGVPPGNYTISAARAGYLTMHYGQARPRGRGRRVEVGAGEVLEGLDIALVKGGTIAGRVFDELGDPSRVRAWTPSNCATSAVGGSLCRPPSRAPTTSASTG